MELDITPGTPLNPIKGSTDLEKISKAIEEFGYVVTDLGVSISKYPLERYKAQKSKKDRVAYPYPRVVIAKVHFTPEDGYFYCFRGECCEDLGFPSVKYGLLQLQYNTNAKGEIISPDISFYAHIMGTDPYVSLLDIKQFASIEDDLIITCTEEVYQKITFTPITGQSLWKSDEKIKEYVLSVVEKLFGYIPNLMGSKITRDDYLKNHPRSGKDFSVGSVGHSGVDFSAFLK